MPDRPPLLMGILNVTPDSFSDGGLHFSFRDAVDAALRMTEEGADLIDVGGESTRPGAAEVPLDEELRRTIPVIEKLSEQGIAVSIDTSKAEVARQALAAGARMVNDVTAFSDPEMAGVCQGVEVCLMHMQGTPRTMQTSPQYGDVVSEVCNELVSKAEAAKEAGVGKIWIDPGIGFGKTTQHNLALLRGLDQLVATGYPVLVGLSRKAFIGRILGSESQPLAPSERLEATLALQVYAQLKGAQMIRVHDVRAARRAIQAIKAVDSPNMF